MNTRVADRFGDGPDVAAGPVFVRSRQSFSVEGIAESIRNFATLSEALRILGAAVLVASMSVFLLQGWSEGNDIRRYLLLLAQTGLLTAAGFAMSHGLQETKGARIFFGLALVSVPANFTILGALLYSVFQWDGGLGTYPDYAHWQIEEIAGTGVTLAAAMLALVPITLFCFAIMARRSAKPLALNFLLLNALLLLPIRSSMAAGSVALLGVGYALFVAGKLIRNDRSLKTGEGKFALAALFIPLGIILFRSMYFYRLDSLLLAMVCMALFLSARQVSLFPDRSPRIAVALESLSLPVGFIAALGLTDTVAPMTGSALAGPLVAVIYALLTLDVLRRTESTSLGRVGAATISVIAALGFSSSVAAHPGALPAILSLAAGAILLFAGLSARSHIAVVAGIITLIAGSVFGLQDIWELILESGWVELAIFGACTIALGSVVDRHGVVIKLRVIKWFDAIGRQRARVTVDE